MTISQWVVRVAGVLALLLGLLFWTGDAPPGLIPIHMLLGVLTVLALWLLAASASQTGVPIGMTLGAGVLGAIVLLLGFTQTSLLQNSSHWVIQVIHLILGMAAVAMGEMIGGRVRRLRLATATS